MSNWAVNITKIAIIGLLTTLSACATSTKPLVLGEALAVTPYRTESNGRIVISAHINEQGPYRFLLDTGASISSTFDHLRSKLDLPARDEQSIVIHGLIASGTFPLIEVSGIRIGEQNWDNPRIVSLPGKTDSSDNIDGILGLDFLQRYAVGFAAGEQVIRLYDPTVVSDENYRGWASVPLNKLSVDTGLAALYFLDVQIGESDVTALFDLGSNQNLINWPGAYALPLTKVKRHARKVLSGALERSTSMARFEAPELKTSGIRWKREEFLVADLEIFQTLNMENTPFVILGSGLFNQRDFVIDFARSRLLVKVSMKEMNTLSSDGTGSTVDDSDINTP